MASEKIPLKKGLFLISVLLSDAICAQNETAGTLRSEGKIYVVVAVMSLVLLALLLFLFVIDRKVNKIIRNLKDKDVEKI